jgi:hypothetical protein
MPTSEKVEKPKHPQYFTPGAHFRQQEKLSQTFESYSVRRTKNQGFPGLIWNPIETAEVEELASKNEGLPIQKY